MSGKYKAVGWNRQKRIYDATLTVLLVLVIAAYILTTLALNPRSTVETLVLRSTALAAILLLHVILCIGPLTRLDRRFLPLLYNRRHLGVAMFLLALVHAGLALFQFHALGAGNPLVTVFTAYKLDYNVFGETGRIAHFPFEPFGLFALIILFVMAATSHDFWLRILGASFWKCLHVLVYVAYGSLLVHVAYGALQYETAPIYVVLLGVGFVIVFGLHLLAQAREAKMDRKRAITESDGYISACKVDELRDGHGRAVMIAGERRAIFRHGNRIYALSNVCRHQGGPIGEGRILDGCITCPWHGWQYRPDNGTSPPPFHEVIETYPVRVRDGVVYVKPVANPMEAVVEGAGIVGKSE